MPDYPEDTEPDSGGPFSPRAAQAEDLSSLRARLADLRRRAARGGRYWSRSSSRRRWAAQVELVKQELALLRTLATLPPNEWDEEQRLEELEEERQRFIAEIEAIAERGRQDGGGEATPKENEPQPTASHQKGHTS